MKTNENNGEIPDLENIYCTCNAMYTISTSCKTDSCIEVVNKGNNRRCEGNQQEEVKDIALEEIAILQGPVQSSLDAPVKSISTLVNETFIETEVVEPIRLFLMTKTNLGAVELYTLVGIFDNFKTDCSRFFHKPRAEWTRDDFLSEEFIAWLHKVGWKPVSYLRSFYRFLGGTDSAKKLPASGTRELFEHPAYLKCRDYLKKRGTKDSSINANILSNIKNFFKWACRVYPEFQNSSLNEFPIWRVKHDHLLGYKTYLIRLSSSGERSELGAQKALQYVREFFTLCYQLKILSVDVTDGLTNIPADAYIPRSLPSKTEVKKFFELVNMYGSRLEQLAFHLLLLMGMRREEVCSIEFEGVDTADRTLTFRRKGGGIKTLPIPDFIFIEFPCLGSSRSGRIFGDDGKFYVRLYLLFKVFARASEWKDTSGTHVLRRKFITNMQKFASPHEGAELAGHSIHMTSRYYHPDGDSLQDAVDKLEF